MTNLSLFAISHIFALSFCLVSIITIAETDINLPEIQIHNVLSESAAPVKVQITSKPVILLKYNDLYKWNVTRNEIIYSTAIFGHYTANWHAFDPSSDAGHAISFWSITTDGIFQSFDNNNYELRAKWVGDE